MKERSKMKLKPQKLKPQKPPQTRRQTKPLAKIKQNKMHSFKLEALQNSKDLSLPKEAHKNSYEKLKITMILLLIDRSYTELAFKAT